MKLIKLLFVGFIFFQSIVWAGPGTSTTGSRGGGTEVALDFQTAFVAANDFLLAWDESGYQQKIFSSSSVSPENYSSYYLRDILVLVADESQDSALKKPLESRLAIIDKKSLSIYINREKWNAVENFDIKSVIALHLALSLRNYESPQQYPFSKIFMSHKNLNPQDFQAYLDVAP